MSNGLLQPVNASNPIVFLDINISKEFAGRVIIELRKDVVPRTAENFRALCTGENGIGTFGKPLHYKGIRFHKVTRAYVVQCGDIVNNNGSGGESIYGPIFDDENFDLKHSEEGCVSMANYGTPNTNNSQFIITTGICCNLDGTNVAVGKVLRGMGIIRDMETDGGDGLPIQDIFIANCGELQQGEDWGINDIDDNQSMPLYPEDWEDRMKKFTLDEAVRILTIMRNAGNRFYMSAKFYDARRKYRKANRYYIFFCSRYDSKEHYNPEFSVEELTTLNKFSVINNVNMAAVELKLWDYFNVISHCSEALRLDSKCIKAYYRRAQAQTYLKNFEDAIADLEIAHKLVPKDEYVVRALVKIKQELFQHNLLEKEKYKKLFK